MNDGVAHIQAIVAQTEYIYLAAPVELPMSVVPVEPAVLKRKAQSPLTEHRSVTRPTGPPSPTSWDRAYNKPRGGRGTPLPLVETISGLPSELPSRRWQKFGKEMGEINLVNEKETPVAVMLTHFHEDLHQQVYIDRSVNNETCHALQRSLLGEVYFDLVASLISLRKRCPWSLSRP